MIYIGSILVSGQNVQVPAGTCHGLESLGCRVDLGDRRHCPDGTYVDVAVLLVAKETGSVS